MVEGTANQTKVASRKPHTPCTGLAAIRDCHDAWQAGHEQAREVSSGFAGCLGVVS